MAQHNKINIFLTSVFLAIFSWSPAFSADVVEHILSPSNTRIGFELGSTFHTVHGKVSGFEGKLLIPRNMNPDDFYTELTVYVKEMDGGNEKLNKKMHNICLEMEKYPNISFKSTGFRDLPAAPPKEGEYLEFTILGDLTIKGTTRNIAIPVKVTPTENSFHFTGSVVLKNFLKDFKIKDPSIFIFRIEKDVEILFEVDIPDSLIDEMKLIMK